MSIPFMKLTLLMAASVSQSPMVESIDLLGLLLGDKQVLSDVIGNLPRLKFLTISDTFFPFHLGQGQNRGDQDQLFAVPIGDRLNHLSLESDYGLVFIQKVVPINMRHLSITGQLLVEFDFSFPQFVFFSYEFGISLEQSVTSIIRRLQASPLLASFTLKPCQFPAGQVESECIDEFKSLLENSKSLRFIDFSPGQVRNNLSSTETLTINLNSLPCHPRTFMMEVHNQPVQIIVPPLTQRQSPPPDESNNIFIYQMPEPGSRRAPSYFYFEGDMLHSYVALRGIQPLSAEVE